MSWRKVCLLALVGTASLALGGCDVNLSAFNPDCKQVSSSNMNVGKDQTCSFKYGSRDFARYVVVVTKPPQFGEATGEGKYLKYVARRGFVGEDALTIRIERRGVGQSQWQTRRIRVTVGEPGQNLRRS